MLIERAPETRLHRRPVPKWLWITGCVLLAAVAVGIILLITHWPFTRANLIKALESASGRQVQIGTISQTYFPPGCTAEGVRFLRHKHPELEPIITVKKLTIQGSLTGMFTSPQRLAAVRIDGMHMLIPPKEPDGQPHPVLLNSGSSGESLAISKIVADGAVLEFISEDKDKKPFLLKIDKLGIRDVGEGTKMSYRVTLTNSEPPGVIESEGKFGPWNPSDIGSTPVSGTYTYTGIDLGHFSGISGKGNARGQFSGPLSRIQTRGNVDVEGFQLDGTHHPVRVATTYDATVNGTNGDVELHPAVARFRRTAIEVHGSIAGHEGGKGKTVGLDLELQQGRVEDLLYLFGSSEPGMTGSVAPLEGKFVWPPGPDKFIRKIRLDLSFGLQGSRFTNHNTQDSINRISESAQGESKKQENEDPRTIFSSIRGKVILRGGTATISGARFSVTGADATVRGTYRLEDQKVDLHGTLDTRGHLSDTTSGFKALVLKAVTPFFKKRHHERMVPFKITGSYGNTSVSIDW